MMNLALMLLAMNTAQARDVKHYFVVCGNGAVIAACAQPFCDDKNARPKAREACSGKGGVERVESRMGKRGDAEYLLVEFKRYVAELEKVERERLAAARVDAALQREAEKRIQEARRAEDKKREKEKCQAKMTFEAKLWACPFGPFVKNPSDCEQKPATTPRGSYALEVNTSKWILPPGESCTNQIYWKDVTHESMLDDLAYRVNDVYNKHAYGEGDRRGEFSFDVVAPVTQAGENWQKAEDRRLAAIPYDCLAGVCLNTPATRIADKLVTVSEVVMHRTVKVCSGRVVEISVSAAWILPGYGDYVDIPSGAEHATYTDGTPAVEHLNQISSEMQSMGWAALELDGLAPQEDSLLYGFAHNAKKGPRGIKVTRDDGSWVVLLFAIHPDQDALCAPKRQQGL